MKALMRLLLVKAVLCFAAGGGVGGSVAHAQIVILSGTQTSAGTATAYSPGGIPPPLTNTFAGSAPNATQSWNSGPLQAFSQQPGGLSNARAQNQFISTINPASGISYSCAMRLNVGSGSFGVAYGSVNSTFEIRFNVVTPTVVQVTGTSTRNCNWQRETPCLMTLAREGQPPIVNIDNPIDNNQFGQVTVSYAPTMHTLTPGIYVLRSHGEDATNLSDLAIMNMSISMSIISTGPICNSIDFNNDTSTFDPQDIEAFLSVYSEGPCIPATATCNDIDYNNDGSLFDPCDIDSFLTVYTEGPCTPCGV